MGNLISEKPKIQKSTTKPKYTRSHPTSGKRGETTCLNGIAISGEYVYTAEDGKKGKGRIAVYSFSGEFITSFSNSYMVQPWSIETHRNNIYVSDIETHTLFHFGETDGFIESNMVGGKGSGDTEFNCPTRISVSSNGEVYVADRYNNRVQVLDWRLKYRRSILHPTLTQPVDVKTVRNTQYVLSYSDSDSYNVHTFTANGNTKSMDSLNNSPFIKENIVIQFGPMTSIVTMDTGTNQIKVLKRKGDLLQKTEVVCTAEMISSSTAVVSRGKGNHGFTINSIPYTYM